MNIGAAAAQRKKVPLKGNIMSDDEAAIKDRLFQLIAEFFNLDPEEISPEISSADIDGWDSIAHVSLLIEIEQSFSIRISTEETANTLNVGDLVSIVLSKLKATNP